jgi:hypothetical protein
MFKYLYFLLFSVSYMIYGDITLRESSISFFAYIVFYSLLLLVLNLFGIHLTALLRVVIYLIILAPAMYLGTKYILGHKEEFSRRYNDSSNVTNLFRVVIAIVIISCSFWVSFSWI